MFTVELLDERRPAEARHYDAALETFSRAIQPHIEWSMTPDEELVVSNDTRKLYRYFDATPVIEFLFAKVTETVRKDLKDELGFVATYDAALAAVATVVDMPDRKASLFVRLVMQNGGTLSATKRRQFAELTDGEIAALESAVRRALVDAPSS